MPICHNPTLSFPFCSCTSTARTVRHCKSLWTGPWFVCWTIVWAQEWGYPVWMTCFCTRTRQCHSKWTVSRTDSVSTTSGQTSRQWMITTYSCTNTGSGLRRMRADWMCSLSTTPSSHPLGRLDAGCYSLITGACVLTRGIRRKGRSYSESQW